MDPVILAVYGNVVLERAECPLCGDWAFVRDGASACCGVAIPGAGSAARFKRMSEPEYRRRRPSAGERAVILDAQGHRCLYCDRSFGSYYQRGTKLLRVRIAWDHFLPYSLTANNYGHNFVAACSLCNGIKSNRVFQSVEEVRVYVQARAEAKGITACRVPPLRRDVPEVQSQPALLPEKVPVGGVEPRPPKTNVRQAERSAGRALRREQRAKARTAKAAIEAAAPRERRPDPVPAGPQRGRERRPVATGGGASRGGCDVSGGFHGFVMPTEIKKLVPPPGMKHLPTNQIWGICHHCDEIFERSAGVGNFCSDLHRIRAWKAEHKEAA